MSMTGPSAPRCPIPPPASPEARREPLPWQRPKPVEDDSSVPARLKAIMESPS